MKTTSSFEFHHKIRHKFDLNPSRSNTDAKIQISRSQKHILVTRARVPFGAKVIMGYSRVGLARALQVRSLAWPVAVYFTLWTLTLELKILQEIYMGPLYKQIPFLWPTILILQLYLTKIKHLYLQ